MIKVFRLKIGPIGKTSHLAKLFMPLYRLNSLDSPNSPQWNDDDNVFRGIDAKRRVLCLHLSLVLEAVLNAVNYILLDLDYFNN